MMVTTSDHVLMNMAGFGDDREIEGDVLWLRNDRMTTTTHPL